jgi:hypothetical protein
VRETYAAYLRDLMNDPRLRRTRREYIPADHPDASLRLDRCLAPRLTVTCENCRVSAICAVDDLRASFGSGRNIMALPGLSAARASAIAARALAN